MAVGVAEGAGVVRLTVGVALGAAPDAAAVGDDRFGVGVMVGTASALGDEDADVAREGVASAVTVRVIGDTGANLVAAAERVAVARGAGVLGAGTGVAAAMPGDVGKAGAKLAGRALLANSSLIRGQPGLAKRPVSAQTGSS